MRQFQQFIVHLIRTPEGKRWKKKIGGIIANFFSSLIKTLEPQIQKFDKPQAQHTSKHIVIKLFKISAKESLKDSLKGVLGIHLTYKIN